MTVNDCNEFILEQFKGVANLQEILTGMFEDREKIEDEFEWYLCVESCRKRRCKWLDVNGLQMCKSEKKLWNKLFDSIGRES